MRPSEVLALSYFLFVCGTALALMRRRTGWRRALGWAAAGVGVALTARFATTIALPNADGATLRDWWLLPTLPLAYWAPAPLVGAANVRLERWLQDIDARLGLTPHHTNAHGALELAYLLVYPIVPAGLLAVIASGGAAKAEVFWLALLTSVLPCYGLLPLLPTRPPRTFARPHPPAASWAASPPTARVRRANVTFLATFGNQWNTLPSGHAAGAVAVALLVWRSGSPAAPLFALLAFGIVIGTVRGRYHYAVDTVLGVLLGIIASLR